MKRTDQGYIDVSGSFVRRPHPRPRQLLECRCSRALRIRTRRHSCLLSAAMCLFVARRCSQRPGRTSTRHRLAVRERDHRHRRLSTSLHVCRAAEPHPSRLWQSIHLADCAVCSFDHRMTRMTCASSLLVRMSSFEQLYATSGARITLLPPHLA